MGSAIRRFFLTTVGRLYAGIHEWWTFAAPHPRFPKFSDETRAAVTLSALLSVNAFVATAEINRALNLGLWRVMFYGTVFARTGAILGSAFLVTWGMTWAIKRSCTSAIERLQSEGVRTRFWNSVAIIVYIGTSCVSFVVELVRLLGPRHQ
jgi:hypothetical protein